MFCKNCGANVPEESKFCIKCGAIVNSEELVNSSSVDINVVQPKKKKKIAIIVISILMILIIAVSVACYMYMPVKESYPFGASVSETEEWIEKNRSDFDIKRFKYGDAKQIFIEIHNYDGFDGVTVNEVYGLFNDKLNNVMVNFSENGTYTYTQIYDEYKNRFTKIYGEPTESGYSKTIWKMDDISIAMILDEDDETYPLNIAYFYASDED